MKPSDPADAELSSSPKEAKPGAQRLPLQRLQAWEALGFGVFFCFGMSTFEGIEFSDGTASPEAYAPTQLDVDQWVTLARKAGARYAVLTTKHTAGHCLWPSAHTDYHVAHGADNTDVVGAFVNACNKHDILPGLYYCAWDNHHRMGSRTPGDLLKFNGDLMGPLTDNDYFTHRRPDRATVINHAPHTTARYREFLWKQIEEICTRYGPLAEFWLDIPGVLPQDFREDLYQQIGAWQTDCVIMANLGVGDGSSFDVSYAWPSDLISIERSLPNSQTRHQPWRNVFGKDYYMPGEVCDPIGREWFYVESDQPRSDAELLGMYLVSRSRGTNLLLAVPPDRSGRIPVRFASALLRLRANLDRLEGISGLDIGCAHPMSKASFSEKC